MRALNTIDDIDNIDYYILSKPHLKNWRDSIEKAIEHTKDMWGLDFSIYPKGNQITIIDCTPEDFSNRITNWEFNIEKTKPGIEVLCWLSDNLPGEPWNDRITLKNEDDQGDNWLTILFGFREISPSSGTIINLNGETSPNQGWQNIHGMGSRNSPVRSVVIELNGVVRGEIPIRSDIQMNGVYRFAVPLIWGPSCYFAIGVMPDRGGISYLEPMASIICSRDRYAAFPRFPPYSRRKKES